MAVQCVEILEHVTLCWKTLVASAIVALKESVVTATGVVFSHVSRQIQVLLHGAVKADFDTDGQPGVCERAQCLIAHASRP